MRFVVALLLAVTFVAFAQATVHFNEEFGSGWESRWTPATSKEKEGAQGKWVHASGEFFNDAAADKGIQTSEDNRFYGISAGFHKFSNKGKDLVLQYQVKFPQKIDCGGGYLKFGPSPVPGAEFHGETPYNIMFGPDFCGPSTRKVHVIFTYKGKNHLIKRAISPKDDTLTHLYTLIVKPDNTYKVLIDNVESATGKLTEDWDFLPAKEIKDPAKSKPSDWVDEAEIDDPTDKKPADWENTPKTIADPDAKKPEDWDDALDGEWEAPTIANPEYKGDWKAKRIPNPAYKGQWVHPMIANPEYKEDANIYAYDDFSWVGVDVWQVKSGTIFDNIWIGDDADAAAAYAKKTFEPAAKGEKEAFEKAEAAKKAAEAANPPPAADAEADKDEL